MRTSRKENRNFRFKKLKKLDLKTEIITLALIKLLTLVMRHNTSVLAFSYIDTICKLFIPGLRGLCRNLGG